LVAYRREIIGRGLLVLYALDLFCCGVDPI
jgi:hypothetical protein